VPLTRFQIDMLRALVRMELRRKVRGQNAARAKFRDEYESERNDRKIAFLSRLYAALGGNPAAPAAVVGSYAAATARGAPAPPGCVWVMCDTAQDHARRTAPSELNPNCSCHKDEDGWRLVHRHEAGCPQHGEGGAEGCGGGGGGG
jgi:hypothetical protein